MGKLVRVVIQLPIELKNQLDLLKQQGYTASGYIRAVLEREFTKVEEEKPDHFNQRVRPIPRSSAG
jgi:predicted DNA-binding protein